MALESEKPLIDANSLVASSSMKGSNSATKHRERITRLSECKKRSRKMSRYIKKETHDPELGFQLAGCANYLVFNNYYTIDKIRLSKVFTCKKHLLCPFCARTRGAKQVASYLKRFEQIRKEKPKLISAILTFTVKNGLDLSERFEHLTNSFKKLQEHRRQWLKKGRGFNELCKIDGAVFSYETTYDEVSGWHPHLHAVVLLEDYVDVEKLSKEWEKVTGDSFIVDIRKIKGDSDHEMAEAFCEVFKYALKFSDLELDKNYTAYKTLKGKRLQGSFGSFRGVKVPETMTDELFNELPYLEMFYSYRPVKGGYDLRSCKDITKPLRSDFPKDDKYPDAEQVERLVHRSDIVNLKKSLKARKRRKLKKLSESLAKYAPRRYDPN